MLLNRRGNGNKTISIERKFNKNWFHGFYGFLEIEIIRSRRSSRRYEENMELFGSDIGDGFDAEVWVEMDNYG